MYSHAAGHTRRERLAPARLARLAHHRPDERRLAALDRADHFEAKPIVQRIIPRV
jgi:hypothetical protein